MCRATRSTAGLLLVGVACFSGRSGAGLAVEGEGAAGFTHLVPLAGAIVESSPAYPGGRFEVSNLVDGDPRTEYSSDSRGTDTFVEFAFEQPTRIATFRHLDRNDPANVRSSRLVFKDDDGREVGSADIAHVCKPAGITLVAIEAPVTARRVRWQVTALGPRGFGTVGGAGITFYTAAEKESAPMKTKLAARVLPVLERKNGRLVQPLRLEIEYPYAEPVDAVVRVEGLEPQRLRLEMGEHTLDLEIPAPQAGGALQIAIDAAGRTIAQQELPVRPLAKSTIYLLPHSHVDIGYTEIQTDVERKQIANIDKGIELARRTRDYPEGARYRWNVEVLWAVESYLREADASRQAAFIQAVQNGWIGLDALYGNVLTGLCRPEELLRLFSYAMQLSRQCGVPIESAMISDVPGYTWGIVSALSKAGVRYWSIGPNYADRIGYTMTTWENRPFWWVGPNGRDRILCWVPYQGYAWSHILRSNLTDKAVIDLMLHLEKIEYPYSLVHARWSGHTDNAPPDETIPDFVKSWNARFESPRLVISTTAETFRAFEERYGDKLPVFSGDWTPYWEDGAGSSARETALNRASAERLVQAETLWALLNPGPFPAGDFYQAWRNVLLYSEHTWGAFNSVLEPEAQFVADQWRIKQAFALDADRQSRRLLDAVLAAETAGGPVETAAGAAIDVFNTASWSRTDLVQVPAEMSGAGDKVEAADGTPVLSQRLSTGELVFLAENVPPMASRRYSIVDGPPASSEGIPAGTGEAPPGTRDPQAASAASLQLDNGLLSLRLDEKTGAIIELRASGIETNLADAGSVALNDYFFVAGADADNPLRASNVRVKVKEPGPLVASLLVESDAPGCHSLSREVRLIAGLDRVEIVNVVDKKRADVRSRAGDWDHARFETKEGLHFGFAFHVPEGVMRMDVPWAVVRPEEDQIPGACKNWFTVQRWVDISNDEHGITWSPLDAPLVQVGAITANLLGSQTRPEAWISRLEPGQTLYSWVMNNHWHTNYRAWQEGPTTFRYAIRPHHGFRADEAARFGTARSQPLVAAPAHPRASDQPRLRVDAETVLVTAMKPSDDGRARIVRLFGAGGESAIANIHWSDPKPARTWITDLSERPLRELAGPIEVPAWGMVSLRAEFE